MSVREGREQLEQLARLYGIQPAYTDRYGSEHAADTEALRTLLTGPLGAEFDSIDNVGEALARRERELWQRLVEPVHIAWDGAPFSLRIQLPADTFGDGVAWRAEIHHESRQMLGDEDHPVPFEQTVREGRLTASDVTETAELHGDRFVAATITIEHSLPIGYHQLILQVGPAHGGAMLFHAPTQAWTPDGDARHWGVSACPWSIYDEDSLGGVGDLSALGRLSDIIGSHGGGVVATTPLNAQFYERPPLPFEPSPHRPVSRLAWNEIYLDLTKMPMLAECEAARRILDDAPSAAAMTAQRDEDYVDYRRLADVKLRALQALGEWYFDQPRDGAGGTGTSDFVAWVGQHTRQADYARFRGIYARQQASWRHWPEHPHQEDVDEKIVRYHAFAQWQADLQMAALHDRARSHGGPGLMLDLARGVHPDGYDAWRFGPTFLAGCTTGTPPDPSRPQGDEVDVAPFAPDGLRNTGYRYWIDSVRFHMQKAGILRIDRFADLHRAWVIPPGMPATHGMYVEQRPEERYAILAIESNRQACMILADGIGGARSEVREAMDRHRIAEHRVLQQIADEHRPSELAEEIASLPGRAVASINTPESATWAGYLAATDLDDAADLGLLGGDALAALQAARPEAIAALKEIAGPDVAESDPVPFLAAVLGRLAAGDAQLVLAGLEDLWAEPRPQAVIDADHDRPNWRRRAGHSLPAIADLPALASLAATLSAARRR